MDKKQMIQKLKQIEKAVIEKYPFTHVFGMSIKEMQELVQELLFAVEND